MSDEQTGDRAFWIHEVQRRDNALQEAKRNKESDERIAELRAARAEADAKLEADRS